MSKRFWMDYPNFIFVTKELAIDLETGAMLNGDPSWSDDAEYELDADIGEPCQMYVFRDSYRAWQHFRDFLNGTVPEWLERCDDCWHAGMDSGMDRVDEDNNG